MRRRTGKRIEEIFVQAKDFIPGREKYAENISMNVGISGK